MRFSIRELIVLTAYAALLVTNHPVVSYLLIAACVSTTLVIGILFGFAALKEILRGKRLRSSRAFLIPLGLFVISWLLPQVVAVLASLFLQFHALLPYCAKGSGAIVLGAASASVPLLAMFDSRFSGVDRQLLWIGSWSLLGGGFGGVLGWIVANNIWDVTNLSNNEMLLRLCALGGLFAAVGTNWFLSPRTRPNPYGTEYDDRVETRS